MYYTQLPRPLCLSYWQAFNQQSSHFLAGSIWVLLPLIINPGPTKSINDLQRPFPFPSKIDYGHPKMEEENSNVLCGLQCITHHPVMSQIEGVCKSLYQYASKRHHVSSNIDFCRLHILISWRPTTPLRERSHILISSVGVVSCPSFFACGKDISSEYSRPRPGRSDVWKSTIQTFPSLASSMFSVTDCAVSFQARCLWFLSTR